MFLVEVELEIEEAVRVFFARNCLAEAIAVLGVSALSSQYIGHLDVRFLEAVSTAQDLFLGKQTGCLGERSIAALLHLLLDDLLSVIVLRSINGDFFEGLERKNFEFPLVEQVVVRWNVLNYAALFKAQFADLRLFVNDMPLLPQVLL